MLSQIRHEDRQVDDKLLAANLREQFLGTPVKPHKGIFTARCIWSLRIGGRTIHIYMSPDQSFITKDIIDNIRHSWRLELLDITYHSDRDYYYRDPVENDALSELVQKETIDRPSTKQALIDNYCDAVNSFLGSIETQKPLLKQREKTSNELRTALMKADNVPDEKIASFLPECEIATSSLGGRIMMNRPEIKKIFAPFESNIRAIEDDLNGSDVGKLSREYIASQSDTLSDTNHLMQEIQSGMTTIAIPWKYFYMDNGALLHNNMLQHGEYAYLQSMEVKLITEKLMRHPCLNGTYISLGSGNGKKDYPLVYENEKIPAIILVDSSIRSLRSAEKQFRGNLHGTTCSYQNLYFSIDRIDDFIETGKLHTFHSVSGTRLPWDTNAATLGERHNCFALMGGTFGNFDKDYQRTFIENLDDMMNVWDHFILSVYNKVESSEAISQTINCYNSKESRECIMNYFRKLWIHDDNISIQVTYSDDAIRISATMQAQQCIQYQWQPITIREWTNFACLNSQRFEKNDVQAILLNSNSSLEIIDSLSLSHGPHTIYILEKK